MSGQALAVALFGAVAIWFGIAVFRTASMVRSALALLAAMAALGIMFLAMEAEFLGVLQLMMMATEMTIMAIFMVMYMMDPGGLGKMDMSHQKRAALATGTIAGLAALVAGLFAGWGPIVAAAPPAAEQTRALGFDLMGRGMLTFETAGVAILTAMIAAICVAIRSRR
ncbi:MAG TPA: NADH-quinone oxidoreductase subunit J [Thermomicrobiales bacterium]|nr:NADH-quinone oxidoreductase subunit J [Thermomicrobiales bacterium]